jgi:hypothetical protein
MLLPLKLYSCEEHPNKCTVAILFGGFVEKLEMFLLGLYWACQSIFGIKSGV